MRFIESILFKNGVYYNLELHQQRIDRTFSRFMPAMLSYNLHEILPQLELKGTYKVRVLYGGDDEDTNYDVEYSVYVPKKIESLQLVKTKSFDYSFKYEDRSTIQYLVDSIDSDDLIIAIDENITDGSYFNLAFWDGKDWLTPSTPLLNGVRRQQLLLENRIKEAPVTIHDLGAFEKISLINAMLDLGELEIPATQLKR